MVVVDDPAVVTLRDAAGIGLERLGGKAARLAELTAAGFAVPPGVVVTAPALEMPDDQLRTAIETTMRKVLGSAEPGGEGLFAVRSSAAAEDLAGASYAGLYETFLNVARDDLVGAVRRCHAAATSTRVTAYRTRRSRGQRQGHNADGSTRPGAGSGLAMSGMAASEAVSEMAVLVQPMVAADAAGVAFTANPVTGERGETVVTAVVGLGERLVAGEAVGDEWVVSDAQARQRRGVEDAIDADQARAIGELAARVQEHYGVPQDIEWVISSGRLWLLQARPMTALPDPVRWTPPGPGLWMRNFRLGEWLPEAMTPLFSDWLLHRIEEGYLAGMRATVGAVVPFRYAAINGWYYNALPKPSPRLLARVIIQSRGRALPLLYHVLIQVSRNPVAADRAVLARLEQRWRTQTLPAYKRLVDDVAAEIDAAAPGRLVQIVDQVAHAAGDYLWDLAIVGGSAWKMEARLTAFCRDHLTGALPDGAQVLLRGLPGAQPAAASHAVHSIDWYHPTAGEHPTQPGDHPTSPAGRGRHAQLAADRAAAEQACRDTIARRSKLLARFDALVKVTQRYAVIREQQARDLTYGWPLLRRCAHRLGEHMVGAGGLTDPGQVYFLTRTELDNPTTDHTPAAARRQTEWDRQRRLNPPLTLGQPSRLIGDPIERAVAASRGTATIPPGALVGHPASAGRATGRVHIIDGPDDFADFAEGEILVAKATAPAWTPLFDRAAAVITDGGTLAAHASLIAREYGIPAVVGTGNATHTLHTGQLVTVDGTNGTITPTDTAHQPAHKAG
jgi:phosphohistidine swiveling domain-containing protein